MGSAPRQAAPHAKMLADALGGQVVDEIRIAPRPERRALPPLAYREGVIGEWLAAMCGGIPWAHQALALDLLEGGANLCLATGTASGKSLCFQAPAIRELLEGSGTVLIFYPQKSLSGDQLQRWRSALQRAGLDPSLVGEIHGNIAMAERDAIMVQARIVIATPDVWHAWAMRQLRLPAITAFLACLRYLVIDEAHAFEGVFGSNSAFFVRRLRLAAARAASERPAARPALQLIAASATIADPEGHKRALTGCNFAVVGETHNGAPVHALTLLHIDGPDHGAPAEALVAQAVAELAEQSGSPSIVAFVDARQGVERITQAIARDDVFPYRSGFEQLDRERIENGLRDGGVRAVVSTSALELGVDISLFALGFNVGVPSSRKSLLQRIGRIGRCGPGAFAVIAPAAAFARLGMGFADFVRGGIEASPLYLANPIIQLQQACCLIDEAGAHDPLDGLRDEFAWPEGFAQALALAAPGAIRPRDIEQLMHGATGCPHLDYPLRKIGETQFVLRVPREANAQLGTTDTEKALREAYPGAIYRHCKQAFRVSEWRVTSYERAILLERVKGGARTRPMLATRVSASHDTAELFADRLLTGPTGSLAETCIQVTESVEGYVLGSQQMTYRELNQTDRRKRRQYRMFRSTGVMLRIDEPWFAGTSESQISVRKQVGLALTSILAAECSIAPAELRWAHTGIAFHRLSGPTPINDGLVIFDNVLGGLRLVEPLFVRFEHFLERLRRGAELAQGDALLDIAHIERIEAWYRSLENPGQTQTRTLGEGGAECTIYAPGSQVGVPFNGMLVERQLLDHQLIEFEGQEHLAYRYDTGRGGMGLVMHHQIQPVGHDWRQLLWDPGTNQVRELE
jgi:DEAD/DEAH box helicase domain-containing protein